LDPKFYKDTNVIEINPGILIVNRYNGLGLGVFTRALFNQINPKKYILFDQHSRYKSTLEPLVKASNGVIQHFGLDGLDFGSYSQVIDHKIITPKVQDKSTINSSLLLVGNITEAHIRRADGFVSQLISFMYQNTFLYYFGRVRTLLWMQFPAWQHVIAYAGHPDRKKVSVMKEVACESRIVAKTVDRTIPRARGTSRRPLPGMVSLNLENPKNVLDLKETDFSPAVLLFEMD
jgi:Ribosomal RNA adenine dimethylase